MVLLQCLAKCRDDVCEALNLKHDDVELSMGMSGDFEEAVCPANMPSASEIIHACAWASFAILLTFSCRAEIALQVHGRHLLSCLHFPVEQR